MSSAKSDDTEEEPGVRMEDPETGELRPMKWWEWEWTRLRGATRNDIDIEEIRQWRKKCETSHGGCCTNDHRGDLQEHLPKLFLIDTQQYCIVESESSTKYVALSYVWGSVSTVKLTVANTNEFMQPGSLHNVTLPHTIRDAISWTAALGERYLWVDCLCVVQDVATEEMNHVLDAMGHVYASAELTIVAANSRHANFGLPGFGQLSQEDSRDLGLKGDHLITINWPTGSEWARRGWTFQESLFARRLLIFGRMDVIYWLCGESCWHKLKHQKWAEWDEENRLGWHQDLGYSISIKSWQSSLPSLKDWATAVDSFTLRTLTFESDFERAFAGARHALGRNFPGNFLHGLPLFFWDIALLWLPATTSRRRSQHPSWSWTGWTECPSCTGSWESYYPVMNVLDKRPLSQLSVIRLTPSAKYTLKSSHTGAKKWLNRFYDYQAYRYNDRSEIPKDWERHCDGGRCFFTWREDVVKGRKHPFPLPDKSQYTEPLYERETITVHCTAQTATVELGGPYDPSTTQARQPYSRPEDHPSRRSWQLMSQGRSIGIMIPQSTELQKLDVEKSVPCLVVAISQGHVESPEDLNMSELHNHLHYHGFGDVEEYHDFYHVLWIAMEDGIATRKGLGIVSQREWDKLFPENASFILG